MCRKIFCSTALAFSAFSASSALSQPSGQPPTACGADSVRFKTSAGPVGDAAPPTAPDQATLYVIMQTTSIGPIRTPRIGMDGTWIGAVHGSSFIRFSAAPGAHHLCDWVSPGLTAPKNPISLSSFQAEPGQSYYFRVRIFESSNGSLQDFEPISVDEGKYLVSQYHLSLSEQK
jgi:hypothetical protein